MFALPSFSSRSSVASVCTLLLLLACLATRLWAAPGYESVAAFTAGPMNPDRGGLFLAADGNLYGVSPNGGLYASGTLFRVNIQGEITVLVQFTGGSGAAKGTAPRGTLVADGQGRLWGTTLAGGAASAGTVFRFDPANPAAGITTVAEFNGTGSVKGSAPTAGLAADGQGNLWGTTTNGGTLGGGTVFRIATASGALTTVAEFSSTGVNGALLGRSPVAALARDGMGHLWGVTRLGPTGTWGTLFKIDYLTDAVTTVLTFTGVAGANRGADPQSALVLASDGRLWGTTFGGGATDQGTLFKVDPADGSLQTMLDFSTAKGAQYPYAGVVESPAGRLWGVASLGGSLGGGTVYTFDIATGTFTLSAGLGGASGFTPSATLAGDGHGALWGTTSLGGPMSGGSIYKVDIATGLLTAYGLTDALSPMRGRTPSGGLVADPDGVLWGTTQRGGSAGQGSIFKLDPATGAVVSVVEFTGSGGSAPGSTPAAGLVRDAAGRFWGTTSGGGNYTGSVFRYDPATGVFRTMATFTGTTGAAKGRNPLGGLVIAPDGALWGTTAEGGSSNLGTVFKTSVPAPGDLAVTITTVVEFTGTTGAFPGNSPRTALVDDGAGGFWGSTVNGGAANFGTLFRCLRNPGPGETAFVSLPFTGSTGLRPGRESYATLVADGHGWLWGTTHFGGVNDRGVVFKLNIVSQVYSWREFTGTAPGSLGANPRAGLFNDGQGRLWGTTTAAGSGNYGTLFYCTPPDDPDSGSLGFFDHVLSFTHLSGGAPGSNVGSSPLCLGPGGYLYGTTQEGGVAPNGLLGGYGQIFRLRLGPTPVTLPAEAVDVTTATLRGTVNPNFVSTIVSFEFGVDPLFGDSVVVHFATPVYANSPQDFSLPLTSLGPATTYYFRIRGLSAENSFEQVGKTLAFTTLPADFTYFAKSNFTAAERLDALVSGPAADPDGDGAANLLEYVAGTNPRSAAARPATVVQTVVDAAPLPATGTARYLEFTFHRRVDLPDVTIHVEVSSDLVTWNEDPSHVTVFAPVPDAGGLTESVTARRVAPLGSPPRAFMRLRVTKP